MKKFILSAAVAPFLSFAAHAADLPNVKGPPTFAPPPPPAFSWTGFYIGAQVGYQFGTSGGDVHTEPPLAPLSVSLASYSDHGVVGGGHIGYNYQVNQFVFGVEGDVEGASYYGSSVQLNPAVNGGINPSLLSTRINLEGSIRGRIGWAWDRVLFYGTGGAAFAEITNSFNVPGSIVPLFDSGNTGRVGWTVGGGVEYALDPNWSIRAEYRYTNYGSYDFVLLAPPILGTNGRFEHQRDNRVEAGFSYKFDMFAPPAPVVAKY